MFLLIFLLLIFVYSIYFAVRVKKSGQRSSEVMTLLISAGFPILTAGIMIYVFIIAGAASTVQFNVGGKWQMHAWSLWVDAWGFLVFSSMGSAIGNLIWMIIAIRTRTRRRWLIPSIWGVLISIMAFLTAGSFYPTA